MAIARNGNPEHSTRFVAYPIGTVFLELAELELQNPQYYAIDWIHCAQIYS